MLPSDQRTTGFATQSFFIGTGAVIASALPYVLTNWFHVQNTAPAGEIPLSVKLSFYIGGAVFISAVLWTIIRTKEYSPGELLEFSEEEKRKEMPDHNSIVSLGSSAFCRRGIYWVAAGRISLLIFTFLQKGAIHLQYSIRLIQIIAGLLISQTDNGVVVVQRS
jgi:maltose/moltooligosaccharide transporter